jgi:hypothetical protein
MDTVKISRKALYARVWAEPMIKVAAEYGLSDRGLAKLCSRKRIPCPPRGYWARLAVGQKPATAPLPDAQVDYEIEIKSSVPDDPAVQRPCRPPAVDLPPIPVPDDLRHMDPLTRWTRQCLDGWRGRVSNPGDWIPGKTNRRPIPLERVCMPGRRVSPPVVGGRHGRLEEVPAGPGSLPSTSFRLAVSRVPATGSSARWSIRQCA